MNANQAKASIAGAALVTASLIAFWQQLEGVRNFPYLDIAGIPTVCAGHTGPDVVMGVPWSEKECDEVTQRDLTKYALVVLRCVQSPLTRGQFEALVVFAGNVGEWAFCNSSLARKLNDMDYVGAEQEFEKWTFYGCKSPDGCRQSRGLLNRRMAELERFKTPPTQMAGRGSAIFR